MSQKLQVNNLQSIKVTSQYEEDFIKHYNDILGCFLEVDVQYLEKLHELMIQLFLPYRLKREKVEKLVANLHNNTEYVIRVRKLKQALNHGLGLKTLHKIIKLNKNAWLKPCIDINTDLKKAKANQKNIF